MKNPKREKLLPCPFDAGKARLDKPLVAHLPYVVRCTTCHASTTNYRIAGLAVKAWNRRAPQQDIDLAKLPRRGALRDMYEGMIACGGLEVHQEEWGTAEKIVAMGLATLSTARGPGRVWKRLEVNRG